MISLIICGISDDNIRQGLMEKTERMSLTEVKNFCVTRETARKNQISISNSHVSGTVVAVEIKEAIQDKAAGDRRCFACGEPYPHPPGQICSRRTKVYCHRGKRPGHIEKNCRVQLSQGPGKSLNAVMRVAAQGD